MNHESFGYSTRSFHGGIGPGRHWNYRESERSERLFADIFPRSRDYPCQDAVSPRLVCEAGRSARSFAYSERHLQAVWYDSRWRPLELPALNGETVTVEYPGRWNLEAGPDFLGATIVVGPDQRRITGDVELHIRPADWVNHGHHEDPRYRNVCLHVSYYQGELEEDLLPPGALQVSMRPVLDLDPSFAFEHIDLSAYPYAGRADVPPCRVALSSWPIEAKAHLLDAAGHERMRIKACRIRDLVADEGLAQAFYILLLDALGYRDNRRPFRRLASLVPLDRLARVAGGSADAAYAVLAGAAGLLPDSADAGWDEETRSFVRSAWDTWWRARAAFPQCMKKAEWRLSGIRPLNHPLRRIAAAAQIFSTDFRIDELLAGWSGKPPNEIAAAIRNLFDPPSASYWSRRVSLGGMPSKSVTSLLGRSRLDAVVMNILVPLAAALDMPAGQVDRLRASARPEPINRFMREALFYLFGPDVPSSLYRDALRRQGLLQVFHDYCIRDRSRCFNCDLPARLNELGRRCSVPAG